MDNDKIAKEAYREILRAISEIEDRYDVYFSPIEYIEIEEERFYFLDQRKEKYG